LSFRDLVSKSSVANVVSAIIAVGSLIYFIYTGNTDGVLFLAGAAIGYLFGRRGAPS